MSDERRGPPPLRTPASVSFGKARSSLQDKVRAAARKKEGAGTVPSAAIAAQQRAAAAIQLDGGKPMMPARGTKKRERKEPPSVLPSQPRTWDDAGIDANVAAQIILRYMLNTGACSGRQIAHELCMSLGMVGEVIDALKNDKLVVHRSTTALGDFITELSEGGMRKAMEVRKITTYVGPLPVPYDQYLESVQLQALSWYEPGPEDLQRAFDDLSISDDMLDRLGPAISSTKPLFLFGEPGNGKTSLAERMTRCFGPTIWIPKTLSIGGTIVKLYDPAIHKPAEMDPQVMAQTRIDTRWILIERPTVVVGGELTLDQLEITNDESTNVCVAPLQMKANCGTLVIDDFGRGALDPKDLLNRWIFPLEKQIDFLGLPDGRKFSVPFSCQLVFSTNLEPKDLADEAFFRRVPYKVHVGDPDEVEFTQLVELLAKKMGVHLAPRSVKYLVDRHYKMNNRPMRFCHPRDLLQQIVHLANYKGEEPVAGPEEWDRVCDNYFSI